MIAVRNRCLALAASLALLAGCGGSPSEIDTAETITPESAKPAPTPVTPPTPDASPAKDVPKG